VLLAAIALAIFLPYKALQKTNQTNLWQAYSPELLADLRAQGRPVFIDLTADWCITCLANERLTLAKPEVELAFKQLGVATLKGDWTNRDPQISALLTEYGRTGVPLYLWYPAKRPGQADILPQLLTADIVLAAIRPKNP